MPPIFSLIAFLIAAGSAQAQDPVNQGRSLVAKFCASCHAVGIKDKSPHPGAPPFRTLGRTIDLDEFPRALERESRRAIPTCQPSSSVRRKRGRCVPLPAIQQ